MAFGPSALFFSVERDFSSFELRLKSASSPNELADVSWDEKQTLSEIQPHHMATYGFSCFMFLRRRTNIIKHAKKEAIFVCTYAYSMFRKDFEFVHR